MDGWMDGLASDPSIQVVWSYSALRCRNGFFIGGWGLGLVDGIIGVEVYKFAGVMEWWLFDN